MSYDVKNPESLTDDTYKAIMELVMSGEYRHEELAKVAGISRQMMGNWLRSTKAEGLLKQLQDSIKAIKGNPFEGARPLLERTVVQAAIGPRKKVNRKLKMVKALTQAEEKQLKDLQGEEVVQMMKESGSVLVLEETEEIVDVDGTLAFRVLQNMEGGAVGKRSKNDKEIIVVENKDGQMVEVDGEAVPALKRGKDCPDV